MALFITAISSSNTSLQSGANNKEITYSGSVFKLEENDVTISASTGNTNVTITSVTPQQTFPTAGGALKLNLELSVDKSGGGLLQVTVTIVFTPKIGLSVSRDIVFSY